MTSMKFGMIFTGGTIGTVENEDGVRVLDDRNESILMSCFEPDDTVLRSSPFMILSENIKPSDLNRLMDAVRNMIDSGAEGVIITHGMDTLQYTAAYLGYTFSNADIPIMILTSFKPLDMEGSNGITNLRCSIDFIRERRGSGVFVPFTDDNVRTYIHRGTRLLQNYDYELGVRSISDSYYGFYDVDSFRPNSDSPKDAGSDMLSGIGLSERSGIMVVRPCVGMPGIIVPDDAEDIILVPYRSGTMDLTDRVLIEFMEDCKTKGVRMWMVGKLPGIDYSSMAGLDSVRMLPKMTLVSAYMKLWMLKSADLDLEGMYVPCGCDLDHQDTERH